MTALVFSGRDNPLKANEMSNELPEDICADCGPSEIEADCSHREAPADCSASLAILKGEEA
jgi:hypothetical protein